MGYMHIDNLYKKQEFLDIFRRVWVLEKIHGTSAHIQLSPSGVNFFSGGASYSEFIKLFDEQKLLDIYKSLNNNTTYLIYGEAYGGKRQGMSDVYGKQLRFISFDVLFFNDTNRRYFMNVPEAESFANMFGLEFVWNTMCENTLDNLNKYRDQGSFQGFRNTGVHNLESEGIVVRPIRECRDQFGERWIVKHKRDKFRETARVREVNTDKIQVMNDAKEFAKEYVVPMRLSHILDKIPQPHSIELTGTVVKAMIEDIKRECIDGETEWSKEVEKAIGFETAKLYKTHIGFGDLS